MVFFLIGFCIINFFWAYTDTFVIAGGAITVFLFLYIAVYYGLLKRIRVDICFYQSLRFFVIGVFVSVGSICLWVQRQQIYVVYNGDEKSGYNLGVQKSRMELSIVQHVRANAYIGKTQKGGDVYLSSSQSLSVGSRIGFVCTPVLAYRPGLDSGHSLRYVLGGSGWRDFVLDDAIRFQRRLTLRGMQAYCFVGSFTVLGSGDLPFWYTMRLFLQKKILGYIQDPLYRSLLLGSTIGDASQFSQEKYQQFVDAGLVHLLVVSGGNIALLLGVLNVVLIRMPIRWRRVLCMFFIALYTYVCGADSSILRAAVMSIVTLLAILGGRTIHVWRLLGYAMVVLLIINPYFLVYDLGFLLSFGAVAGICLWSSVWQNSSYMKYISSLWGAVYGTLPIVLFLGSGRNVTSVLANLCVEFLYILLYVVIFLQGATVLFGGWVSDLVQMGGEFVAQFIFWIAETTVVREIRVGEQFVEYTYLFVVVWIVWGVVVYNRSVKKNLEK